MMYSRMAASRARGLRCTPRRSCVWVSNANHRSTQVDPRGAVNYGLRDQEAATSLITPTGECQAHLPYGQEGVLVQTIKEEEATGLIARRYAPERYRPA